MSQHDFNIANQTASATRADLNNALGALASLSSGTTAPTTTYANMLWYETDTNWLWVRNEADSAWIRFAYFNQGTGQMAIQDNTEIVGTGGSQTGLLGDQSTATWQAGTGTTQSLVSPENVKAAILALTPAPAPQAATDLLATLSFGTGAETKTVAGSLSAYKWLEIVFDASSFQGSSGGFSISGNNSTYTNVVSADNTSPYNSDPTFVKVELVTGSTLKQQSGNGNSIATSNVTNSTTTLYVKKTIGDATGACRVYGSR